MQADSDRFVHNVIAVSGGVGPGPHLALVFSAWPAP